LATFGAQEVEKQTINDQWIQRWFGIGEWQQHPCSKVYLSFRLHLPTFPLFGVVNFMGGKLFRVLVGCNQSFNLRTKYKEIYKYHLSECGIKNR
jgi:hypothetical protein